MFDNNLLASRKADRALARDLRPWSLPARSFDRAAQQPSTPNFY